MPLINANGKQQLSFLIISLKRYSFSVGRYCLEHGLADIIALICWSKNPVSCGCCGCCGCCLAGCDALVLAFASLAAFLLVVDVTTVLRATVLPVMTGSFSDTSALMSLLFSSIS